MKKLLVTLVFLGFSTWLMAQSLSDIQNIKVDNLSDAQIEQLIKRAEAQGLNDQQLEALAIERGMPAGEVAKLRQRINSLRSGSAQSGSQNSSTDQSRSNSLRTVEGQTTRRDPFDSLRKSDPYYDLTPTQKKIFGYTLFYNKNINFNPSLNIPTPPNYVLGPGDQLLIDVFGASQQSYDLTINPEGSILIPNVGVVRVGGSSVSAASSRIKSALTQIYSGLAAGNTFLEVRLGNIKTVNVMLAGELNKPGNYALPSFASPLNALFAAGGPNENGSFRHVQVYRDNKLLTEFDVYDFITKGDLSSTITLRDNDVIIVPPIRARVEITGPVRREGLFEVKSGESLEQVLNFAGGFGSEAYRERLTVSRKTGKERKVEDVDQSEYNSFLPQDGDEIRVGMIQNRFANRVQVTGALMRPGVFALEEGMGIKDLIQKAEGLREDAFLNRATLYRTRPDFSLEIVTVNIGAVVRGEEEDILLQKEDVLTIPSIYELREEYYVKISGEVNNPGSYTFGEKMTVADIVLRAGGFKESASASQIEIARRVKDASSGQLAEIIRIDIDQDLKINPSQQVIELKPFDHVVVRRSPGFQREKLVRVEGEVVYPGEFVIANANERISDVLKRAGGLNQFAYVPGATLIRRNEFYEGPSDNELRSQNLLNAKFNITQEDKATTDAEKLLLTRIDKKTKEKGGDLSNQRGGLVSDDFRKKVVSGILDEQVEGENTAIRTTELIGINLKTILENPYGPEDLLLQEGDILSIPKQLQTVRMRGEVLYPTTTRYKIASGLKYYISRSGGFTENSKKSRTYVVYANGDVSRTKKVLFFNFYPSIQPGAEIIVPQRPERQPMSVQAFIGIASSLATLGILVDRLVQQ